ncbi:hypothetical protein B0H21DRAFT_487168 [Amylocystis lapponica]|nr:hypothetical protein B0H21DRAFT_487168 [Amylocystis lapponica]
MWISLRCTQPLSSIIQGLPYSRPAKSYRFSHTLCLRYSQPSEMAEEHAPDNVLSALTASDREALFGLSTGEVHIWAVNRGKEVEKYLRSLHTLQNSTAPVNRLPNELLVGIFHLMDPRPGYTRAEAEYMRWIKLMTVCRYWHDVAVASPGLWNKIDVSNGLPFLLRGLERSQNRPLEILASKSLPTTPQSSQNYCLMRIAFASCASSSSEVLLISACLTFQCRTSNSSFYMRR